MNKGDLVAAVAKDLAAQKTLRRKRSIPFWKT